MRKLVLETRYFLIHFSLWVLIGSGILLNINKGDFLIWLNHQNHTVLDHFFFWATYFGDGIFVILISFLLCFVNVRYGILSLVIYLFSGAFVQILKNTIDCLRPSKYLEHFDDLHHVPGVVFNKVSSFPSGHTASAFGLFFLLAILFRNKKWGPILFLFAATVGISRIYLLQHFLIDVMAGSIIGIFSTILVYIVLNTYLEKRFQKINLSLPALLKNEFRIY